MSELAKTDQEKHAVTVMAVLEALLGPGTFYVLITVPVDPDRASDLLSSINDKALIKTLLISAYDQLSDAPVQILCDDPSCPDLHQA